jgi:hypothetical protein
MRLSVGLFVCLILFVVSAAQAQRITNGSIKGTVIDSLSRQPLEGATISVFFISDSSLIAYALTNRKGEFTVKGIPPAKNCWLMVSYNGYADRIRNVTLTPEKKDLQIQALELVQSFKELTGVTIVAQRPPVVIKQDTMEFNAGSFTTAPNAMVEDVLKQLPGVEIDREGNILINGKKVNKIMLDGKEFFGGDPKIAIKNLPKELIDKIQVMDNKTREARFNRTSDGNEDLAINLTLKKEVRKGWFGRASAGYGTDSRYEAVTSLNYFDGATNINFIGNANNTNRAGFSGESFNISSGRSSLGGGGSGNTASKAAGLNFSSAFGKKLKLNGSYFFNTSDVTNFSRTQRQNILSDSTLFYNSRTNNASGNDNHRLSVNVDYVFDTLSELHISTSLNSNRMRAVTGNEAYSEGKIGEPINTSVNTYTNHGRGSQVATETFFSRRFKKKGRGITLGVNFNYNDQSSENTNIGENVFYKAGSVDSRDSVNQFSNQQQLGNTFSMSVTYSEPVIKNLAAHLRYTYNKNVNRADKLTNRFNPVTGEYDIADPQFTNAFKNTTASHQPGISLIYEKNKFRSSAGTGLQFLTQDNYSITGDSLLHQSYVSFMPSASIGYNYSKTGNISFFYNGRNQQPSIQQLQPVPDNSNPLYIQLGNPDLKPSFFHNIHLSIRQSAGNSYWFAGLNFNSTANQIIYATYFDDVGRQVSRPVNVNGNYSVSGNINYSKSWKRPDWSFRVNLGSNGSFNRNLNYIDSVENIAKAFNWSQSVGVSFTWQQMLTVQPAFNIRINNTRYSVSSVPDAEFVSKGLSMNFFWNHPKRLIIESGIQYNYNSLTAPGFRKGVTMWSAAVNWLLFKQQQGAIRVAIYDILKQNAGISRSITQTYIEDRETQVLQQYVLVSFVYNIRKFGN